MDMPHDSPLDSAFSPHLSLFPGWGEGVRRHFLSDVAIAHTQSRAARAQTDGGRRSPPAQDGGGRRRNGPHRTCVIAPSAADEPFDGAHGFGELAVALVVAVERSFHDSVPQVFVDEADADALRSRSHRRQLGQDVDVVLVALDHALQAATTTVAVIARREAVIGTPSVDTSEPRFACRRL